MTANSDTLWLVISVVGLAVIVLRRSFTRKGSADKWIGDYPNGHALIVRYDPNKARDSVIFEREQAGTAVSST